MKKIISVDKKETVFQVNMKRAHDLFSYPKKQAMYQTSSPLWVNYGFGIKGGPGKSPDSCILDLFESYAVFDCERTAQAVMLISALGLLGTRRFNLAFLNKPIKIRKSQPFHIEYKRNDVLQLHHLKSEKDIKIGDWLYIENSKNYLKNNPNGRFSGEHVIAVNKKNGTMLYTGFLNKYKEMTYLEFKKMLAQAGNCKISEIQGFTKNKGYILARRINQKNTH